MKEIIEFSHHRLYKLKFSIELMLCIITSVQFILGISSFLTNYPNQYWNYDPLIYFLYTQFPNSFIPISLMAIMPFSFSIVAMLIFNFSRTDTITLGVIYDLIVQNSDQVQQCLISKYEQSKILNERYRTSIKSTKNTWPILWTIPPIRFLLKRLCWRLAKFKCGFSSDFIDQVKIENFKLLSTPYISFKCRAVLAGYVKHYDLFFYYFHFVTGN